MIGAIQMTDQVFQTEEGNVGNCEMDTHADTCVAGANFLACEFNGITCEVIRTFLLFPPQLHGRTKRLGRQLSSIFIKYYGTVSD
jgi:hypothetical protein